MADGAAGWLRSVVDGVELLVHVQPRAARTSLAGEHGGRLKVRVAAPPVDGAANEALVLFLADRLSVPRRAVRIVAGETGRQKAVHVSGVTAEAAARALS